MGLRMVVMKISELSVMDVFLWNALVVLSWMDKLCLAQEAVMFLQCYGLHINLIHCFL